MIVYNIERIRREDNSTGHYGTVFQFDFDDRLPFVAAMRQLPEWSLRSQWQLSRSCRYLPERSTAKTPVLRDAAGVRFTIGDLALGTDAFFSETIHNRS